MAKVISCAGVSPRQITVIENWSPAGLAAVSRDDASVAAVRRTWGLTQEFVVAYSGNLGRVHDLEPVIAAAALVREARDIVFVFVGAGAQRENLKAEAERLELDNVRFIPSQPRENLGATLAAADIHLVTLRPGCEDYVYPSKLYGITAVGRPILFVGPAHCEIAEAVESAGIGRAVDRDDVAALAEAIRQLSNDRTLLAKYGKATAAFAALHTAERAAAQWQPVLASMDAC
jgi:glycosyltransferase involved in cell wall biosynthesis